MKRKTLILVVVYAVLIQIVFAQESVVIGSQHIEIQGYPGKYSETKLRVSNNLDFPVVFVAARVEGDISDIVGLENTRISVDGLNQGDLPIRFYILHKASEGEYSGDLVVSTGAIVKKIPLKLVVLSPEELFKAKIEVEPFTEEIQPGGVLSVVVYVTNLGEGDLGVLTDVILKDPDNGRILGFVNQSLILSTEASPVLKIPIPENTVEKKYLIEGNLYALKRGREGGIIASATAEVEVNYPLFESLTLYAQQKLEPSKIKVFLSMIPVAIILVLGAVHYRREAQRRRRYLESIDFDSLPRPSRTSGYLGRVAETTNSAFLPLDDLMMHVLIAGATGSGKTVSAKVLVEEALLKNKAVVVFDPTAQWTGFIKPCKSRGMVKLYPHFKMKKSQSRAFYGNIYLVEDPHLTFDIRRFIRPGEITIFSMQNLTATQLDLFVENTVKNIFRANLEESTALKLIVVYDEVHRLLPKFGGSGRGFIHLERAAREFRKWGVGLVLISQVLSDFVGEIKANIGTEIQMRTRYEQDLKRIKLKYDRDTMRSIVKENVGTGMLQNAEYNQGRPYFISFRPLLHDHHKLTDGVLGKYNSYNLRLDRLYETLKKYKVVGSEVFDLDLELNLTLENLKRGLFDVVDLYLDSLEPKVSGNYYNLTEKQQKEFEKLKLKDKKFIKRSKDIEAKIEREVESLPLLKKSKKDGYWKEKLEKERARIEKELEAERKEMEMVVKRLNRIKSIVKDKEELKSRLDSIREGVESPKK